MRYPVRVISCCFEVLKKDCKFLVCSIPCLPNRVLLHSSSHKLLRHVLVLLSTVVVLTLQPSYFLGWYLAHASVVHGLYSSAWCDCTLRNVPLYAMLLRSERLSHIYFASWRTSTCSRVVYMCVRACVWVFCTRSHLSASANASKQKSAVCFCSSPYSCAPFRSFSLHRSGPSTVRQKPYWFLESA